MQASITATRTLTDLPSASGVERVRNRIFIIGDDSAYLYSFDQDLGDRKEILLFEHASGSARIPKKLKPDFEALAYCELNNRPELFVFGSGSKRERRDKLLRIELSADLSVVVQVREFSLSLLYETLRSDKGIVGEGKLNIEAAVVDQDKLLLFQRGSSVSPNVVLIFSLQEFLIWAADNTKEIPSPIIRQVPLPDISGIQSGFSGAVALEAQDAIIFSASSEDRSDAYDDGKVFGCIIGAINRTSLYAEQSPIEPEIAHLSTDQSNPFNGKIESVAMLEQVSKGGCKITAVTDDDRGGSELLTVEIQGL